MGSIDQEVWRLELSLLSPEIRARPEPVEALLADDFLEFGRSGGVHHKAKTISALTEEASRNDWRVEETDREVKLLAADVALVTYQTMRRFTDRSVDLQALRSWIWRFAEDRWRLTFHPGTPAP